MNELINNLKIQKEIWRKELDKKHGKYTRLVSSFQSNPVQFDSWQLRLLNN